VTVVVIALLLIGLCFCVVLAVGAPYVPTLTPQVRTALELADLQPGDTLLELGCGDGKVLIAAAQQGVMVVGYELNPILVVVAWLRTRRYRKQVQIIWGNFWTKPWPQAEAIFVFLLPKYMEKLHKKVVQYNTHNVKLVSFAFTIPDIRPVTERDGVYLYSYK
jgi:Mycolic acid cyclopropane synthetase